MWRTPSSPSISCPSSHFSSPPYCTGACVALSSISCSAASGWPPWCAAVMATDPVPAVELRGLVKQFGGHEALASIDLAVMPGETVCIVGPSGSGEWTLPRGINWLGRPDRGSGFLPGARVGYCRADGPDVLQSV